MKIKPGVNSTGIRQELILALRIADSIWSYYEITITSLNDGKHSRASLHYSGAAADIRTRDMKGAAEEFVRLFKESLGNSPDYDVVLESDHIHLEWQPKYRGNV